MNPNDAYKIICPLGYDEGTRRLKKAFKQKLCNALDQDCGDIEGMRSAYCHGDFAELGRLISASMDIYQKEYGDSEEL